MKKVLLSSLLLVMSSQAKSITQYSGDFFAAAIPLSGYGATLYLNDKQGQMEFYKSYGVTIGATYALKYSIREKRPDTNEHDSFPSGHTASAFSGATFIHQRYGLKYAILPYILAVYTGYTRVDANRHYVHDVVAGALLGSLSSYYFTSHYKDVRIEPTVTSNFKGIRISYDF